MQMMRWMPGEKLTHQTAFWVAAYLHSYTDKHPLHHHNKKFSLDIENSGKQEKKIIHPARNRTTIAIWLVCAAIAFGLHFLLASNLFNLPKQYHRIAMGLTMAAAIGAIVMATAALAEKLIMNHPRQQSLGYNLVQFIRLLSVLLVIVIFISFLFHNWYTAAVSLGLISLILGFALQTPISSFIGWLYIIFRSPYRVTDRIQINGYKGDVVEIGYLDTTLWEFGGDYLTNDLPSGRLIRFPNSLVLQSAVYNYSWHKFPYIWNEIPFHIAYESDLAYVEKTLREITLQELGNDVIAHVEGLKQSFEETPVGEIPVKEFPYISFRTNANTWLEATVTYLVEPKRAAEVRSRILKKVVSGLLQQPDKVLFPKTNSR